MSDKIVKFIEESGLDRQIELSKLKRAILKAQEKIEYALEDVAAIEWPKNIFGKMYQAVEDDDVAAMIVAIGEWQRWMDNVPPKARRIVDRVMARVETFIDEYCGGDDDAE